MATEIKAESSIKFFSLNFFVSFLPNAFSLTFRRKFEA